MGVSGEGGSDVSDTILHDKRVTTRKPHKCFGCRDMMPAGTVAWYTAGRWSGEFFAHYLCETCNDWIMENLDRFEEFGEGDVKIDREEAARDAEREERAASNMDDPSWY